MKKQTLTIILGFLLVFLAVGAVSATAPEITGVVGSLNPSSSGIAQDLASSQNVAWAVGKKYGASAYTPVVDSELSSSVKYNSKMNIIVYGGPVANSITKELVKSGKSKVNWATSPGQTEIIHDAWGKNTANVFIVAGEDRGATQSACNTFASNVLSGNVPFIVGDQFVINPSAGSGGSISPNTPQVLNKGNSITFKITPQSGYSVKDVMVDDKSVGAVTSYTFTNVNADHSIRATFQGQGQSFTITPSADSGGSISPNTPQVINKGGSVTFQMNPNIGMQVADVKVDGISQGPQNSYTFTDVNANHSISVSFTPLVPGGYTIQASAGSGGSINPIGTVKVNAGDDITFTMNPNFGMQVDDVVVDGVSQGPVNSYTFFNVDENHVIYASFSPLV